MSNNTREIKLYRRDKWNQLEIVPNLVAIVDEKRYEVINKYTWFLHDRKSPYPTAWVEGVRTKLHHMISGCPISGFVSDHINRNIYNTKEENLRIITRRQNNSNISKACKSKFPGVVWSYSSKKWMARIIPNPTQLDIVKKE